MSWNALKKGYKTYLELEKSLADNSVEAYLRDIDKLTQYLSYENLQLLPKDIDQERIQHFLAWVHDLGMSARSQARIISGLRSFYDFLELENEIRSNPMDLIETPKIGSKLPDTLSTNDVLAIIDSVDLSSSSGTRDKAILETLYSCGLRVSELTTLRISHIFDSDGFVRIVGKGNKERLIPIGRSAMKAISIYVSAVRNHQEVHPGHEDFVFLNQRGKALTRMSIFNIVKRQTALAGIRKKVSPHTFRHSFASHMVEAGADLRAVQEMLGHESITTTEIYTHLDRDYLRQELLDYHPRNKG
ncbi:MAG: site-specific tyrosine recombinase XerD [Flavobacteriales bacterium]|nr:site-specific tyrosine recombinase XerD [Flavobacteriales bacterium]